MRAIRFSSRGVAALGVATLFFASPVWAQRIVGASEPAPEEPVVVEQQHSEPERNPSSRPGMVFIQPLQTALYTTLSLADQSSPRIAVPIGLAFEANESADYLVELTANNLRGTGTLQGSGLFGSRNSGHFSRTSLFASVGYQMYSMPKRTGLFLTPKFYGALFQDSQTSPERNMAGGQLGAGVDIGASLQLQHICLQLVMGMSLGITGGAIHSSIVSPLFGVAGGSSAEASVVIDLNANLLRVGFAF